MALGETGTMTSFSNAMRVNGLFERQFKMHKAKAFLLENLQPKTGKVKLGGRTMEVSLETRGMASFGAIDEMEPIVEADQPGFKIATVPISTLLSRLRISLQAELASESDKHAWAKLNVKGMNSTVEMFAMNMSRTLWGYGTARLARVDVIDAATKTLTLVGDQVETGARPANGTFGPKYIIPGMFLAASSSLTSKTLDRTTNIRCASRDRRNNKITYSGDIGDLLIGDYLVLGSRERTSAGRTPMGVPGYVDDGVKQATVLNIDRTVAGNEFFKSFVKTAIGGANLENEFRNAALDVETENGGETSLIMVANGVMTAYGNSLMGDRRFVTAAETGKYKGGFAMAEFLFGNKTIPITADRDVPAGFAIGFDWDDWYLGELRPVGWLNEHDKPVWTWVADYLAYECVRLWMGQLICCNPNKNWKLTGIDEA